MGAATQGMRWHPASKLEGERKGRTLIYIGKRNRQEEGNWLKMAAKRAPPTSKEWAADGAAGRLL